MDIKAKIIEKNPDQHYIVVRFYSDKYPERHPRMIESDREEFQRPDGGPERCRTDRTITLPIPAPDAAGLATLIYNASVPAKNLMELWEKIDDPKVDTSLAHIETDNEFVIAAPVVKTAATQAAPAMPTPGIVGVTKR